MAPPTSRPYIFTLIQNWLGVRNIVYGISSESVCLKSESDNLAARKTHRNSSYSNIFTQKNVGKQKSITRRVEIHSQDLPLGGD